MKLIGRYLTGTMDKGLILDPWDDFVMDCYPDMIFLALGGMNIHRTLTVFVLVPVMSLHKLQTKIALSTTKSE